MSPPLQHLLGRQDGLLALDQATSSGISAPAVRRRVRSGDWRRVRPGVHLVGGHPLTDAVLVRAAGLWIGDGGAVSGLAAAFWHELLPRAPGTVEVTVPRAAGPTAPPGVRGGRRDLDRRDLVGIHGIWVTDVPLTVLEVSTTLEDGSAFLDPALQRRVSFDRLHRAFCRSVGSRGAPTARAMLVAADRADSAAERILIRLLRDAGLDGWVRRVPFGAYEIDIGFRTRESRSRSTAGRGTSRSTGSGPIDANRMRWSPQGGPYSDSPGTTCRSVPPRSSRRSGPRSPTQHDHDSGGETDVTRTFCRPDRDHET
jgi:predicted transcriptional regulator of viral defense system